MDDGFKAIWRPNSEGSFLVCREAGAAALGYALPGNEVDEASKMTVGCLSMSGD